MLERADPLKYNMGLVTIRGKTPTAAEAKIGKNYLIPDELEAMENVSEQFCSTPNPRHYVVKR